MLNAESVMNDPRWKSVVRVLVFWVPLLYLRRKPETRATTARPAGA